AHTSAPRSARNIVTLWSRAARREGRMAPTLGLVTRTNNEASDANLLGVGTNRHRADIHPPNGVPDCRSNPTARFQRGYPLNLLLYNAAKSRSNIRHSACQTG